MRSGVWNKDEIRNDIGDLLEIILGQDRTCECFWSISENDIWHHIYGKIWHMLCRIPFSLICATISYMYMHCHKDVVAASYMYMHCHTRVEAHIPSSHETIITNAKHKGWAIGYVECAMIYATILVQLNEFYCFLLTVSSNY